MGRNRISSQKIDQINALTRKGIAPNLIAEELGLSVGTVYKYIEIPRSDVRTKQMNEIYAPLLKRYYAGDPIKEIFDNSAVSQAAFYSYLTRHNLKTRKQLAKAQAEEKEGDSTSIREETNV